jgi:uncharacterized protein YhfF
MNSSEAAARYWDEFLATRPDDDPVRERAYVAESFGDSPALADKLCSLIVRGAKTATCSALWAWEAEGNDIPKPGYTQVVLDGRGVPRCVIETTTVKVMPFRYVDQAFAAAEGEGDADLASWRKGHWRYFERTLAAIGKRPTEDMPLVCERFRVLYRGGASL